MTAPFQLPRVAIDPAEVGQKYHLALGYTDSSLPFSFLYGYLLANKPGNAFHQRTDIKSRDSLIQIASPNVTDRDLVNVPRVSDGDLSGGQGQVIYIDPKRYFDSDLDTRTPGYVRLRPGTSGSNVFLAGATPTGRKFIQIVAFNNHFYGSFSGAAGVVNIFTDATTITVAAVSPQMIDTDGSFLYMADGTSCYPMDKTNTVGAAVFTATVGAVIFDRMWVFNQGSAGAFIYYASGDNLLYKVDLSLARPVAVGNHAQIPFGGNAVRIMDLCSYNTGIAILTNDPAGLGFDLWFFDGGATTHMLRVDGYRAMGLCNGMGDLYISAQASSGFNPPQLIKVSGSGYEVVAEIGAPASVQANQTALQPRASGRFIYWPVEGNSLVGQSIVTYNVLTGAVAHLPIQSFTYSLTGGAPEFGNLRRIAVMGDSVGVLRTVGAGPAVNLVGEYQLNNQFITGAFGVNAPYKTSGYLVTSRFDYNTPAINKQIRRLVVSHAPLAASESVTLQAWVDKDPLKWTSAATQGPGPNQYTAQVVNSTVGSTETILQLPGQTIGKALFASVVLTGPGATSPALLSLYSSVSTPWAVEVELDCTNQRKNLDGNADTSEQGLRGRDLYCLLNNAWENDFTLLMQHPNGLPYNMEIEEFDFQTTDPTLGRPDPNRDPQDLEGYIKLVLRQTL